MSIPSGKSSVNDHQTSDEEKFRELHDAMFPRIHAFFIARGVPQKDALDLTRDVFVELCESRKMIRDPERVRGVAWAVCRNVLREWLDRQTRFLREEPPRADSSSGDASQTSPSSAAGRYRAAARLRLHEAIRTLPLKTGLVARMKMEDDLSTREIARALGTTPNNVGLLLQDSKARLRNIFEPNLRGSGGQVVNDGARSANWVPRIGESGSSSVATGDAVGSGCWGGDLKASIRERSSSGGEAPLDPSSGSGNGGGSSSSGGDNGSSGSGGRAPQRYLQAQFQETVRRGGVMVLEARIALTGSLVASALTDFEIPKEGCEVLITLKHSGFANRGESYRYLHVPYDRPSSWIAFELRASEVGVHDLELRAYAGGAPLGALSLQVAVHEGKKSGSIREKKGRLHGRVGDRGDFTFEIDYDERQKVYQFRMIADRFISEPIISRRLENRPQEAVEAMIQELNRMARGERVYDASITRLMLCSYGQLLWDELIPEALQYKYWQHRDEIRRLYIYSRRDPIPWEILYPTPPKGGDGCGFLVEQVPIGRWVHGETMRQKFSFRRANLVSAVPSSRDAEGEIRALDEILRRRGSDVFLSDSTDLSALLGGLREGDFNLLHIACHNAFEPKFGAASEIAVGRERFPVNLLRPLRRRFRKSPFVFVNACRSGSLAPTYTTLQGWAKSMVEAGAGAFMGSLWEVREDTAAEFSRVFYASLTEPGEVPCTFGEAMMKARYAIQDRPGDPTWLAYSLYGDPGACLVA